MIDRSDPAPNEDIDRCFECLQADGQPPEMTVLWLFPEVEFEQWRESGCGQRASYQAYLAAVVEAQQQMEQKGRAVELVGFSVEVMLELLERWELENNPDNRALVTATVYLWQQEQGANN